MVPAAPFRLPGRGWWSVVWVTVWLLAGLLVGGGVWWRWAWERWRRALVAEQAGRTRDRFVTDVELVRWEEWACRVQGVLEERHAELLADRVETDFLLWESELGDGT